MKREDEVIGTIEDVVGDARLVDKGRAELNGRFYGNAPSFDPEKRKFLKHAAVLAGLIASGRFLEACSTIQEPVTFQGKTYGSWEAYLMTQDLIRGPQLLIHPSTGLPSDFEHHIRQGWSGGFGAVDYSVPIGTPIVPTINAFRTINSDDNGRGRTGGNWLDLYHRYGREGYKSMYVHLDKIADVIQKGEPYVSPRDGKTYRNQLLNMLKIVAFSGNTGVGPGGGFQPEHLHFQIMKIVDKQFEPPGIDPFQAGIDANKPVGEYGGRPVYWDGQTEVVATRIPKRRKAKLQETLDTYPKRVRESNLENEVNGELVKKCPLPIVAPLIFWTPTRVIKQPPAMPPIHVAPARVSDNHAAQSASARCMSSATRARRCAAPPQF